MRTLLKPRIMFAVGCILLGVSAAYAATALVGGDFTFLGGLDKYRVKCSAKTPICTSISNIGEDEGSIFTLISVCMDNTSLFNKATVGPGESAGPLCLSPCTTAEIYYFCDVDEGGATSCSNDYAGTIECVGTSIKTLKQTKNT